MSKFFSPETQHNLALVARILRYFTPYKWLIAFSFVCLAITAGTTGGTAWLIRPALDDIFVKGDTQALLLVPLGYVGLTLLKGFARYGQSVCMNYSGFNVLRRVRSELFERIITLPLGFFEKSQVGLLMSHVLNDVGMMQRCLPSVLMVIRQSLTMLVLLGVVFYQNYQLALGAIIILPIAGFPMLWFSRRLRKYGRKGAQISADLTSLLQEQLSGVRVIKAFATEGESRQLFDIENTRQQKLSLRQSILNDIASPFMELVASFGIGVVLWYGGSQVISGEMTTGAFFSFIAALVMLYDPFKSLNAALMDMQNALAGAERIFGLMDNSEVKSEQGGTEVFDGNFQELCFGNVGFAYSPEDGKVLDGVNLTIRKGERVALVGPSGAGKSTFANLIPRFYQPQEGSIRLNGKALEEYDLASLRRNMAVVSQDAFLFNMSVSENIVYGQGQANKADIDAAAKAAYVSDFINTLPEGYATVLGERGIRLSGGQKQRLTIARALIKNAPLLILDEATSALDSESEKEVQKALDNLMEGRTSLVIAHRLSTILTSDRIVVLDKGRIVAVDHHQNLLETCPLYARLYELQFGKETLG